MPGSFRKSKASFLREHFSKYGEYRCYYCGNQLSYNELTIDHYIPLYYRKVVAKVNSKSNFRVACQKCNSETKNYITNTLVNLDKNLLNNLGKPATYSRRLQYEIENIKKLGPAFVEEIKHAEFVYNCSRKQAIQSSNS